MSDAAQPVGTVRIEVLHSLVDGTEGEIDTISIYELPADCYRIVIWPDRLDQMVLAFRRPIGAKDYEAVKGKLIERRPCHIG